jgi:hypothetical protein
MPQVFLFYVSFTNCPKCVFRPWLLAKPLKLRLKQVKRGDFNRFEQIFQSSRLAIPDSSIF